MERDRYIKLRELLANNPKWPRNYMFKFIVPNVNENVERVVDRLPKSGILSYKHTQNLNYVSVTCTVKMHGVDPIIEVMENVSQIEGVMVL
jgi:hypothetical protein